MLPFRKKMHEINSNSPLTFLPFDLSARADMTLPRDDKDWLIAAPSFNRSPVAPVDSALSLMV